MITYYQELLNECIDITKHKEEYKNMLLTLETMKDKLNELKGVKENGRNAKRDSKYKRIFID